MIESITSFLQLTGFSLISWQMVVMWAVVLVLFYFAIYKKFEPLLLVPIAFGALVANLPTRGIISFQQQADGSIQSGAIHMEATVETVEGGAGVSKYHIHKIEGGLFDLITQGVKLELFPPLIFLGVGALTDFGPLIANPRTLLLGAAAQLGVWAGPNQPRQQQPLPLPPQGPFLPQLRFPTFPALYQTDGRWSASLTLTITTFDLLRNEWQGRAAAAECRRS